jgi:ABC-type transporter Mla MlaB component
VGSIKLATVALEGKLLAPWVDEVRTIVTNLLRSDAVRLNLDELSFADSSGIVLLHELDRAGVDLCGCSPLITGLLAECNIRQGAPVHR